MSKGVKRLAIVVNLLILVLAIFWVKESDFDYEPIIVLLGQLLSLIVLTFGDSIRNEFSVKKVSKSKVSIDIDKKDNGEYNISDIVDNSEIRIRKK